MKAEKKKEVAKTEPLVLNVFTSEQRNDYKKLINGVNSEIKKAEKSYLQIAFKLHHIYTQHLYEIDNYKNIYECAAEKFGYARGTCNNYINICNKFGEFNDSGICIGLKPGYENFGASQLQLMVSVDEKYLPNFDPSMTISHMKNLAKSFKCGSNLLAGNTSDNAEPKSKHGMNPPEEVDKDMDDYLQDKDGFYTAKLAEVPDLYNISKDVQSAINESVAYFKEKHPNTKFRFSIALTW